MYYITALPALMLFVVSKRAYNFIMQIVVLVLLLALVIPDEGIFARNIVSYVRAYIVPQICHLPHV